MSTFGAPDSSAAFHSLHVDAAARAGSVHGAIACIDCHPSTTAYPHAVAPDSEKGCARTCHARRPDGTSYTHALVVARFAESVHGAQNADAPTCLTCHQGNAHAITKTASAFSPAGKSDLCATCHADVARMRRHNVDTLAVESYHESFHGKAIKYGATDVPSCQSCHTAHHVMKPSDPRSSVNPAHIRETCGQSACHPGAEMNFAMSGANHLSIRMKDAPVLRWEARFFFWLTGGTLAALMIGIVLDLQRKFGFAPWLYAASRRVFAYCSPRAAHTWKRLRALLSKL